jgi:ribonucleotide reductase beta subunit family protein with ferritin-like domain
MEVNNAVQIANSHQALMYFNKDDNCHVIFFDRHVAYIKQEDLDQLCEKQLREFLINVTEQEAQVPNGRPTIN